MRDDTQPAIDTAAQKPAEELRLPPKQLPPSLQIGRRTFLHGNTPPSKLMPVIIVGLFIAGGTYMLGNIKATPQSTAPADTSQGVPSGQESQPRTSLPITTAQANYSAKHDANSDGHINSLDVSSLLSRYGQNDKAADTNADGIVNDADFSELTQRWTW